MDEVVSDGSGGDEALRLSLLQCCWRRDHYAGGRAIGSIPRGNVEKPLVYVEFVSSNLLLKSSLAYVSRG